MNRFGILDTGPLVAFLDKADGFHEWSVEALAQFTPPVFTCDAVIAEAWHLLGRARGGRQALLGLLGSRNVEVTFSLSADAKATLKLMSKYADVPMSVADACLVRMAELEARSTVVTLDGDFRIYRTGRSPLRTVSPAARRS